MPSFLKHPAPSILIIFRNLAGVPANHPCPTILFYLDAR
ncbi:hypothetical protein LptCag_0702 [Leptospirillum ferriphilum]|uniref:Uncharacterized protein n=1 Tax=Leptospirillum ferriphilum TaxID=178606 RepID=A0A094YLJ7_9BACT|nr:hypothetical protein LptCag_0702 [Leptospirillum ferriphilum]